MIRLEDVHKSFGELEVLKGIDLHVKEGEKLGFRFIVHTNLKPTLC